MSHQWMTPRLRTVRVGHLPYVAVFCQRVPVLTYWRPHLQMVVALLFALCGLASNGHAQSVELTDELSEAKRVYVPAEDLDVVVERDRRGTMLTKKKFEELLGLAKANATKAGPNLPIVLTSGSYQARIVGDQMLLSVTAEFTQFASDWQLLNFAMQRISVEKATLDNEPAMLGRNQDGSVSLLSDGKGPHTLQMELSTELTSQGSDQVAAFALLRTPTGTLSLTLPAGKRLLVGALQLERPAPLDQPADYKIAIGGASGIQLRITDRAAENASDALTFASTGYGLHVAPGEVTWHALTTLQIFGKPVDRLTFTVPATLEIADVEATGLEAWALGDDPDDKEKTVISLTFGQAFDGSRKISFKGVMAVETGNPWAVPPLTIKNITSHVGQVVVQYPAGVRLRIEESEGVRRATQEQKPAADMPDEMAKLNATEFLRFDVWQPDFVLRLTTQPKQREVQAAAAVVLDVNATGLDLQAILTVTTHFAPLFELDIRLPAEWTVLNAQRDGTSLKWQVLSQEPGVNQLRILLDPALAAEATATIRLTLRREVEGWPVESEPIIINLPELFLPQSNLNEGTFVVRGDDDLDLTAFELTGLDTVPLQADYERLRFQSQDTRYGGKLKVSRKPSRISVQTITFGRLDPQTMHAFIQAMVEVQGGGVRTLKVVLPESAGTALRFQSPIRPIVEQKSGPVQNGERTWTLQFDQRIRGTVPLFCDIDLPRGAEKQFVVPQARFVEAERQNGFQAVEAGGEQRLSIDAKGADGVPLSEVDPLDLPNVYYVPKERIVAVYRNVTAGATLTLSEERFDRLPVPTAVCPTLEVTSVLGRTGEMQHRADFQLIAVGVQGLRVTLPRDTLLWATMVDGQPVEVRRQGDIYLVPLNSRTAPSVAAPGGQHPRRVQLFYRSEVAALSQFGTLEQPPPELAVQTGQGTSQPVDVLDQHWRLYYPEKTFLVSSSGPMEPEQPLDDTSLLGQFSSGVRIPNPEQLAWQTFSVVVALGVIAVLLLAYRRGLGVFLAAIGLLLIIGIALMSATAPQQKMAVNSRYEHQAPPAAMRAPASAPPVNAPFGHTAPAAEPVMTPMVTEDSAKSDAPADFKWADDRLAKDRNQAATGDGPAMEQKRFDELKRQMGDLAENPPPAREPAAPAREKEVEEAQNATVDNSGLPLARRLALLSLAIELSPPEGTLQKSFRYIGAEPSRGGVTLKLGYVDEQAGNVMRVFLIALVALLGWFLRRANCATKVTIVALGLTLPLALLPLAPQTVQVVLDGIFFGIVVVCGLWLLMGTVQCLQNCCASCCGTQRDENRRTVTPTSATLGAFIFATLMMGQAVSAQPNQQPIQQQGAAIPAPPSPPVHRDTVLIVPFDAGTDPLAADKILLPYEKFVELYRQAYPDKPNKSPAPYAGGVVEALYSAKIVPNEKSPDDSTAEFTARFAVRSYVDGQLFVELPIGAVAARSAKLDGKNAPLIVEGTCSKVAITTPGLHVIDFQFSVPARLSGTTGSFTLPLLPTPTGKLTLELPAKGLSVRINGSSTVFRRVTQGDVQSIEFPVDKGGDLSIVWQPEQAKGAAAAVVHVDSAQAITLTDAGIRVSTGFQYRVRQGGVGDVTFSLPARLRLQAVNGADVGGWELQGDGDDRKLRVIFRRNVTDSTQLTIEAFLDERVHSEAVVVEIPQLMPHEVTNEIGQVAVFAGNQFTLRAEKVESLSQVDADKFNTSVPVSRPNVAPQLAYRFSKRPFILNLRVTRQESQAHVTAQQAAFVSLRKQQLTTRLVYNLTGAPRSSFNIVLPAGYVVLDVKATGLHDWSLGKRDDESLLTIDLDGPRLGVAEVVLSGVVPRDDDAASVSLIFPRPKDATKVTSTAAVWLDEEFTGTLDNFDGWRSVDAALVSQELRAVRPNHSVQFAFQSSASGTTPISIKLFRATPKLAANGLAMVSVTDVAIVHTLALQWQIDSATTDSLVFTTPSFLAGRLEFTGSGIRESTHVDAGNGRTRWTIWLRTPVSGKYFAAAVATLPPATGEVQAPAIVFERSGNAAPGDAIEGQRQYVLLINLSQSQLTSATPELTESVQREDVPVVVDQSLVDQATELVRVKQLLTAPRWTLQTFAQTASAPASVNVADLTTVISRDGTYRGQAVYTIKNRSRQFLALRLPPDTELLSVFVGNVPSRAVTTKRNNVPLQLIALPKTSAASLSFPVRVIWRGRLSAALPKAARALRQEFDIPAPIVVTQQEDADFGIPVARTRWTVWMPEDLDAKPLTSSARYNLTQQSGTERDLLYEKAAVQELSELLGYVEQNYSYSSHSDQARRGGQATNNLKQIGLAFQNAKQLEQVLSATGDQEFDRQRDVALKRLSTLQESVVADQRKLNESLVIQRGASPENPRSVTVTGNGLGLLTQESLGNAQQNVLSNTATLIDSNGISNFARQRSGESDEFSFELQSQGIEAKPEAAAAQKPASGKSVAKGANTETRQQLRNDNRFNIDSLNDAINQQKIAAQGQQQQGRQFGSYTQGQQPVGGPGAGGMGGFSNGGDFRGSAGGSLQGPMGEIWQVNPNNPNVSSGAFMGQLGGAGNFTLPPGTPNLDGTTNHLFGSDRLYPTTGQPTPSPGQAPNGPGNGVQEFFQQLDRPVMQNDFAQVDGERMRFRQADAEGVNAGQGGAKVSGAQGWKQVGGLSLDFALPTTGRKLVFSKAGGDPKLALAVRPQESIRWGLNLVWSVIWLTIGVGIAVAVHSASGVRRISTLLPIAVAVLSVLGFVVLPPPLNGCAFVTFVIASLIVAWINRRPQEVVRGNR